MLNLSVTQTGTIEVGDQPTDPSGLYAVQPSGGRHTAPVPSGRRAARPVLDLPFLPPVSWRASGPLRLESALQRAVEAPAEAWGVKAPAPDTVALGHLLPGPEALSARGPSVPAVRPRRQARPRSRWDRLGLMVVRVGKRIQRIDRDDVLLNTALPLFLLAGVAVFAAGVWKIAALLVEMI